MVGLLVSLGALVLQAPIDPLADIERQQQALFERIAPATVFISTEAGFGSGFLVDANGLILTCAHVLGHNTSATVVLLDGRRVPGKVIERAEENADLALMQIPLTELPSLPLELEGSLALRVGSWVASVGHGEGGIWSFNVGSVSNIYFNRGERAVFQTQIPLNPGNSGGPIVDRSGRVVGIVQSGIEKSNSINFAIRIDVALGTLSRLRAISPYLIVKAPTGVPIFVDGKMVGTGPRALIAAQGKTYDVLAVINGTMKRMKVTYPETRYVELR